MTSVRVVNTKMPDPESFAFIDRWNSRWLDIAVLVCGLFLIVHNTNAPIDFLNPPTINDYAAATGNVGKYVGSVLLICYGVLALLQDRRRTFSFRNVPGLFAVAFMLLVTVSLAWSETVTVSASRWFGLLTYTLAGAGAVKRLGIVNIVRWFLVAELFYLLVGVANELRLGTFNPFAAGYRFQGINDANNTGAEAALLLFASIAMLRSAPRSRLYRTSFVVAILLMLLTKSRTALLSSSVALLFVYGTIRLRGLRLGLYIYGLLICISLPFVLDTVNVFSISEAVSLGRTEASHDTLTGRIPLWTELYDEYIEKRPLLGYGYGAFWTQNRIEDISTDQDWLIAAAHSIYIDSILAVGCCGGLLYVGTLLSLLATSLRLARHDRQEGFFFACALCALLFDGFSDSGPWYIASMYLFASTQAVFVCCSLETQTITTVTTTRSRALTSVEPQSLAESETVRPFYLPQSS